MRYEQIPALVWTAEVCQSPNHKSWRSRQGRTHKSSNGSSLPRGHSSKGDHQEDDDGADAAEEVLGNQTQGGVGVITSRFPKLVSFSSLILRG